MSALVMGAQLDLSFNSSYQTIQILTVSRSKLMYYCLEIFAEKKPQNGLYAMDKSIFAVVQDSVSRSLNPNAMLP